MHRGPPTHGDPDLAVELEVLAPGRATRVAGAVIDVSGVSGVPMTRLAFAGADTSTRFEIGSISKALTGMLLADAVERGEISLETEVGDVIVTVAGTDFGSITMKELCTHTSGLPRMPRGPRTFLGGVGLAVLGFDPYRGIDPSDLLRQAARQRLANRGRRQYSNLGAAVLGQVLAIAAATDFPSLLSRRILAPVGMDASVVARPGDSAAPGRSPSGRGRRPWIVDGYAPAGGVISTIEDMARLAEAVLDGSAPGLTSVEPIDGDPDDDPRRTIGMLWDVISLPEDGGTIVGHNGRTGGYSSLLALLPRAQRAVIVLVSVSHGPQALQRVAGALLNHAR